MNRVIARSVSLRPEATLRNRRRRKKSVGNWKNLLCCIGAGVLVCGGVFLFSDLRSDWFRGLARPVFCPPTLVACLIFLCQASALTLCNLWVLNRSRALVIRFEYGFHWILQLLASAFFFQLRAVFAALVILTLTVVHSVFLMKFTRQQIGSRAFVLLVPLAAEAFFWVLCEAVLLLN